MAQRDPPSPADADPRSEQRVDPAALQRHLRRHAGADGSPPWLHGEVARRMSERLGLVKASPRRIADWWSDLGHSQDALQQHYPKAERLAVEPPLLAARQAPRPRFRLPWRARPAPTWPDDQPLGEPVDLLWANMMLHWVDPLPPLLARWQAALAVDGFLMFSCFGPDTLRELNELYREAGWAPGASAWLDMHDIGDALVHAGFADPVMDMELLTLSWPDAPALLAELRTLGGNTAPARMDGLRTPRWHADLQHRLEQKLVGPDGRLHLTFEVIYGHAFKPAPRVAASGETHIPLDTMRQMVRQRGTPPS